MLGMSPRSQRLVRVPAARKCLKFGDMTPWKSVFVAITLPRDVSTRSEFLTRRKNFYDRTP
jgi:hypothetical protein